MGCRNAPGGAAAGFATLLLVELAAPLVVDAGDAVVVPAGRFRFNPVTAETLMVLPEVDESAEPAAAVSEPGAAAVVLALSEVSGSSGASGVDGAAAVALWVLPLLSPCCGACPLLSSSTTSTSSSFSHSTSSPLILQQEQQAVEFQAETRGIEVARLLPQDLTPDVLARIPHSNAPRTVLYACVSACRFDCGSLRAKLRILIHLRFTFHVHSEAQGSDRTSDDHHPTNVTGTQR
jgi:hypothetical protein